MNKQRIPPVDPGNASGTNKKNSDTLNFAFGFMPNMPLAVAHSQAVWGGVIRTRHSGAISSRSAMHENLVFDFRTMRILPIACLVAFAGCSGIGGTAGNQRVTANLAKYIEEDHEKTRNPRVRVGQPYDQGLPELARD
jgi:hypothetical protein